MKKLAQFRSETGNILADICSETRYEQILARLFNAPSGQWISLKELSGDLSEFLVFIRDAERKAADLDKSADNPRLFLCWIPYPDNEDYCTIFLFLDQYLWSWMALYHRAHFFRRSASPT